MKLLTEKIKYRVADQVWGQVRHQVGWKAQKQVWNQVLYQVQKKLKESLK